MKEKEGKGGGEEGRMNKLATATQPLEKNNEVNNISILLLFV